MTADPTNLGLFATAQHRTGNRAGAFRFLGIGRRANGEASRPILLAAPDLPGEDARQYARDVRAAGVPVTITPGKNVEAADLAMVDNITSIDELRGAGSCQRCSSTNHVARVKFARIPAPVLLCSDCRPRDAFGVVDGGAA